MNRLANERSAYLRHAARQKVDWHPWSDEAFATARTEDKPVFLSTGAVWCHWCHVMAEECFENDDIAALLNRLFVPVKLDRDERPEIDRRYQQAVAAMGGGSGWPLSVFLTPDREAFYGGTYFPPEDRQGRPGFGKVLVAVHDQYRSRRDDVAVFARRVMESFRQDEHDPGPLSPALVSSAEQAMLAAADAEHGGFGGAPKFPLPAALGFLLWRAGAPGAGGAAREAARRMLTAMARGGMHDHLGGGFHRYAVDEAWTIPHFEKMADDNAGLLRNYIDGYALFGDGLFRDTALGIISFTLRELSDPAGGFFASQDADVTPRDEGGYFTWTEAGFREVLSPDEYPLLSAYLLHPAGRMHHDPAKHVLFAPRPLPELAASLGISEVRAAELVASGKAKLLAAREKRDQPFIDRALYTNLNGMLIAAHLHAASVLEDRETKDFALRSLDRIVGERYREGRLEHAEGLPALLDDHVYLVEALVAAYEATAERRWLALADELMTTSIERFYDHGRGGFFDTAEAVLGARLKKIEDVPHPSANGTAVLQLQKLARLTDKEHYGRLAEETLRLFAGFAREIGVHGGSYFCGLDAHFRMLSLVVEAAPASVLARTARRLAATRPTAVRYGEDQNRVVPCCGTVCLEPIADPGRLAEVCKTL